MVKVAFAPGRGAACGGQRVRTDVTCHDGADAKETAFRGETVIAIRTTLTLPNAVGPPRSASHHIPTSHVVSFWPMCKQDMP